MTETFKEIAAKRPESIEPPRCTFCDEVGHSRARCRLRPRTTLADVVPLGTWIVLGNRVRGTPVGVTERVRRAQTRRERG